MDITIRDLYKSYDGHPVLAGLSLVLPQGQTTALMGRSGIGKTTLLRLLMGLQQPDAGSITGVPARCAAVFQEPRLCPQLTVQRNLMLATGVRDEQRIAAHLREVGLQEVQRAPVHTLSGGMQQRVSIVRAVLAGAQALFLDEPFKGLDEHTRADTIRYLRRHTAGATVVLVTHSPEEAAAMGARVVTIKEAGA